VSKRQATGAGAQGSARGLRGYLRDRPIWVKLGLIMMVPTLATIVVGFSALFANISAANDADRARTLASLSADSGAIVDALQNERAATVLRLGTQTTDTAKIKGLQNAYQSLFDNADAAIRDYHQHRNALTGLPDVFETRLGTVDSELNALPGLRTQVLGGTDITLALAEGRYDNLISSLISIRDSSAQLTGDANLNLEMRAGAALAQYKETVAQERTIGLRLLLVRKMFVSDQQQFVGSLTGQSQTLVEFKSSATGDLGQLFDATVTAPQVQQYESSFYGWNTQVNDVVPTDLPSPQTWDSALSGQGRLVRQVEQESDKRIASDAADLHDRVQAQVLVEAGLLLALVLVAVLIAWMVARQMNRSLRELRHGALAIAQYGLPHAVQRLRDPAFATQNQPHQVALQIADPLPVRSRDEFGQVTEAFNAVHLEAVRTAAEQAALRASVATMFINLARRSQILVDRLIGHLDRLERGEEDPDRLAELFQLDHLATRMRRNDENLLVLAGADSSRVQREAAALIDVLRAAQSEVEHYTRIEFGIIDRDIEVDAAAVNDLVHLVAELFDNATAFSPPDSSVIVEARRVGDRAVLYVEDRGIGISADQLAELNERLAAPPEMDVAVSRMMGLVVVARLAARHGVRVELRPAHERGTIADVLLPGSVLVPRLLAGRVPSSLAPGRRDVGPSHTPRQLGSPLALESGPSGGPDRRPVGFGGPGGYGAPNQPTFSGFGPAQQNQNPRMPAWSDLTGATNGSNGSYPQRREAPAPGTLPQRRPGEYPMPTSPAAFGGIPRQPRSPESDTGPKPPAPPFDTVDADLVDDREPYPWSAQAPPAAPPRPAPLPPVPPGLGPSRPAPLPPASATPPGVPSPAQGPGGPGRTGSVPMPSTPPPAWPPLPDQPRTGAPRAGAPTDEAVKPPVPEELAAALDITSEIPRIAEPVEGGAAAPAPGAAGPRIVRAGSGYPDETMEMPIFRELESAWFRSRKSMPLTEPAPRGILAVDEQTVTAPAGESPIAKSAIPGDTGSPQRHVTSMGGRMSTPEPSAWRTAADEGWQAAQAASQPEVVTVTSSGLPKRVPMAQLVPGGVDSVHAGSAPPAGTNTTANANRRSPEQVRGLLSAYHRGVQRGRTRGTEDATTPDSSTTSPHGGKEHE
jgi:signal transduction histidine kinase